MKIARGKKGQVLVMALAVVFTFFLLTILIVEVGHFFYRKMKLQNQTDSMAMQSGILYSRSLNLTSVTNKFRYITYTMTHNKLIIAALIALEAYPEVKKADDFIYKAQAFEKLWLPVLMVYTNVLVTDGAHFFGKNVPEDEKVYYIPIFVKNGIPCFKPPLGFFTDKERKKEKIKYKYTTPEGKEEEAKEKDVEYDPKAYKWRLKKEPKYYVDRTVEIEGDKENKKEEEELEKAIKDMSEEALKNAAEEKLDTMKKSDMYIEETGSQEILVLGFNEMHPLLLKRWMPDGKWLISLSKVRIEGGSMKITDWHGARYHPKLENADISQYGEKVTKILDIIRTNKFIKINLGVIDELFGTVEKVYH